jgi:uncharacterized protein
MKLRMKLGQGDETFTALFTALTSAMSEGVQLLTNILRDMQDIPANVQRLKDIEHRGDDISHELYTELNRAFITPFDREDIYQLASALDDVLDLSYSAGQILMTHDIRVSTPAAQELAAIIVRQCEKLSSAVKLLPAQEPVLDECKEIRVLEHEADDVARAALGALFDSEPNPIQLIKLKGLYEVLERATDKAEDAADVLEAIVLKQS